LRFWTVISESISLLQKAQLADVHVPSTASHKASV
jgi:hypothetical protein